MHWRALACSGVLWLALACIDVLWRALAYSGVLWRALACFGVHLRGLACVEIFLVIPCILPQHTYNIRVHNIKYEKDDLTSGAGAGA